MASGAEVLQASRGGDPKFGPKVLPDGFLSKVSSIMLGGLPVAAFCSQEQPQLKKCLKLCGFAVSLTFFTFFHIFLREIQTTAIATAAATATAAAFSTVLLQVLVRKPYSFPETLVFLH